MDLEKLNVAYEERMFGESILDLQNELARFEDDVAIHRLENKGPQASIILLTTSAIAIIFGSAFVKKIGDRAADDFYPILKKGLKTLFQRYFGKNRKSEEYLIVSGQSIRKAPSSDYSLTFALYCVSRHKVKVKFLYKIKWEIIELEKATESYLSAIMELINCDEGPTHQLITQDSARIQPVLISWDEESNKLTLIDPFLSHQNRQSN